MGFLKDFKSFATKGNVMDLAVGVIIGAAFGKIVSSLVEDVLMPVIGIVNPEGKGFDDKFIVLNPKPGAHYESLADAKKAGVNILAYGHFMQTVIDFFIIAFCIFLIIKAMANMRRKEEAAPVPPTTTEKLLTEIRDELKKK